MALSKSAKFHHKLYLNGNGETAVCVLQRNMQDSTLFESYRRYKYTNSDGLVFTVMPNYVILIKIAQS